MAIRCAIYIRRSEPEKESEKNLTSAESQEMFISKFIKQHADWEVYRVYHDNGFSAENLRRPEVQELLRDAESGAIDIIVVYRYDRLTRDMEDYYGRLKVLERRHGVKIVSATEHFDPTTPEGAFSIGQTILHAQLERERTVVRAKDKIASSRQLGLWTGGNIPPGYKTVERKLVPDEAIAPLIDYMFKRYVELRSPAELARDVNLKALELTETDRNRLKPLNRQRVMTILKNPIYKGYISHYEKLYKGQHKAIVDEDLWNQIQEIIKKTPIKAQTQQTPIEFALRHNIRCKECNRAMIANFTSKRNRKYAYYTCLNKRDGLFCKGLDTNINADLVHRLVTEEVRKILKEPETLGGLWEKLSKESSPENAY
jgi:site-specific DNA recombinase